MLVQVISFGFSSVSATGQIFNVAPAYVLVTGAPRPSRQSPPARPAYPSLLFHFLFHVAARDTFPLVSDALPDSVTTQPGKGFYDTQHQLLWVCQPLGELYTPTSRPRKASRTQRGGGGHRKDHCEVFVKINGHFLFKDADHSHLEVNYFIVRYHVQKKWESRKADCLICLTKMLLALVNASLLIVFESS